MYNQDERKQAWEEALRGSRYKLVKRGLNFWYVFGVIGIVFLIANSTFFGYMFLNGKLNGIIQSYFNATVNNKVEVNNTYDFNSQTDNDFKFNLSHTIEIYNNIFCPDE